MWPMRGKNRRDIVGRDIRIKKRNKERKLQESKSGKRGKVSGAADTFAKGTIKLQRLVWWG